MIVTTALRTVSKLEERLNDPHWLRTVIDDVAAGFLIESDEEIAYINRAYAELLGYDSPEQLYRRHLSLIVAENEATRLLEFGKQRARAEDAPVSYDFAAKRRDSSPVRLHAAISTSTIDGRLVIATLVQPCEKTAADPAPRIMPGGESLQLLSPRETQVMEMILAGKRLKEIAFTFDLSVKTVSTHRFRLLRKLHLADNRELFRYALHHHLIDWN